MRFPNQQTLTVEHWNIFQSARAEKSFAWVGLLWNFVQLGVGGCYVHSRHSFAPFGGSIPTEAPAAGQQWLPAAPRRRQRHSSLSLSLGPHLLSAPTFYFTFVRRRCEVCAWRRHRRRPIPFHPADILYILFLPSHANVIFVRASAAQSNPETNAEFRFCCGSLFLVCLFFASRLCNLNFKISLAPN